MSPAPKRSRLTLDALIPLVLSAVGQAEDETITVREISEKIGKTAARTSQIVRELVGAKLLKAAGTRSGNKGKAPKLYTLTAKGRKQALSAANNATKLPKQKKTARKTPPSKSPSFPALPGPGAISQLAKAVNALASALTGIGSEGVTLSLTLGGAGKAAVEKAPKKRRGRPAGKKKPAKETEAKAPEVATSKAASKKASPKKTSAKKKTSKKKTSKKKAAKKAPVKRKAPAKEVAAKTAEPVVEAKPSKEILPILPEAPKTPEAEVTAEA